MRAALALFFFAAFARAASPTEGCENALSLNRSVVNFTVAGLNPNQLHFGSIQPDTTIGRAEYNGRLIFFKAMPRELAQKEVTMIQRVNQLGIGAQLVGTIEMADGRLAVATEFVPGALLKNKLDLWYEVHGGKEALKGIRIGAHTSAEIRRQGRLLEDAGIIPEDLQFLIASDGLPVLIDTGLFQFAESGQDIHWTPAFGLKRVREYEAKHNVKLELDDLQYEVLYYPLYERAVRGLERQLVKIYGPGPQQGGRGA